ncbi:MAG: ribosome maturation factor RimP [Nitrospiria bacterium]
MKDTLLIDKVKNVAEPLLHSLGVELFDMEYGGSPKGGVLRIFIDKKGGITLDDCEKVSRYLGKALDVEDLIPYRYTLEVSSPGLNRPLKKREDFIRFAGKKVKIKTLTPIGNQKVFVGRLADFSEDKLLLALDHGREQQIRFDQIAQARLEVAF